MPHRLWPIALLLLMGAAWGLQFAMLKLAVQDGFNELNVLLIALVLISIIYGLLIILRRRWFRLTCARLKFFVVAALLGYVLPLGATLYAASHLPAGILTLMATLAPLFTFAAAISLKTEPVSRRRIWAMLFGCAATLLVLVPQTQLPHYGALPWMLLALVIPACYGVESIYVSAAWPDRLDVMQVSFGEAVTAALLTLPVFLLFGEPRNLAIRGGAGEYAILVFVVIGVLEVFMYFYLIRITGGVLVSFATFISLFSGIGWGMLIFAESHDRWVWSGVGLLVVSLILVSVENVKRRDAAVIDTNSMPGTHPSRGRKR